MCVGGGKMNVGCFFLTKFGEKYFIHEITIKK
jgi:hypothetical protein